jgi:hypothetical protein
VILMANPVTTPLETAKNQEPAEVLQLQPVTT